jgi:hypothetical protein
VRGAGDTKPGVAFQRANYGAGQHTCCRQYAVWPGPTDRHQPGPGATCQHGRQSGGAADGHEHPDANADQHAAATDSHEHPDANEDQYSGASN